METKAEICVFEEKDNFFDDPGLLIQAVMMH